MNILVVDDNQDLAKNLTVILEEEGYSVAEAFDGKSAIELCRSRPFDLVILDFKLPDMDGLRLQERLAELIEADYLIITAHASIESAATAVFRKQIVGYETKPLDIDRLLAFVRQIVERRRAEEERRVLQNRLESLWRIAQMTDASYNELCDLVLEEIRNLTGSRFSFFGFLSKDENEMIIHSWSRQALSECAVLDKPIHFPISEAGLWGQAVVDRKPFVVNDYSQNNPRKKGLPGGHVPITNLLSVPIFRQDKIIALAAVANKRDDFTDEDAMQIRTFVSNIILIIEKRLSEEKLRESEAKHRLIMENMDDAVYICSSDFRLTYMNPAMIRMTGRDATGEFCHKAIHGLDYKCPWCVHDKVMLGETVKNEVVDAEGEQIHYVSNVPIFHTDGSVSKLTVFRDVTEIRKIESRIRQAERMSAIGTLAGGIAHDFNNILYPIMGYAEMLKEDLPEADPLRGFVNEILHAAHRAKDLVKQILAFGRQTGREVMPVKLQPILKEAMTLLRATIPANIDIQQTIDPKCGVVAADPTQAHQVIMNLATNAFHAMEKTGGTLSVALEEIRLESDYSVFPDLFPGDYARMKMADTGVGIEKDVLDKIFNPYYTTKKDGKGTGLGLSVVLGIVKMFKGDIRVYSEPGKGTEVHVYLPIMERNAGKDDADENKPVCGGTERILLVDDEEQIVRMEQQLLERLGYRVTWRTGSIEAFEVFRANPRQFDLVLTDMAMPNITGIQLAGKIRKIRPDIPIVVCTGFSEQIDEEKCKRLGIQGFVMKPVIGREVDAVIRKALNTPVEC